MSSDLLNMLAIVSLIVGCVSLAVSILTIIITVLYKHQTDTTNRDSRNTLARIDSVADSIKGDIMAELKKYGDVSRSILIENNRSTHPTGEAITPEPGKPFIINDNG